MEALIAPELEAYAAKHSIPEGPVFRDLVAVTRSETDMPQMQVGRLEGALLRVLVRLSGAKRVLEIGTFTGYSALAMAEGLPENGRLITLDVNEKTNAIARAAWDKSPHGNKIEAKLGPALKSLESLEGPFDMVFIDADKENYSRYWDACVPKVRPGGLLAVDNVLWSGRVLDPKEPSDKAIVAFNAKAASDVRVDCAMLTVRDGVLLGVKK
ncbi:MAG: methyltransferase [Elusimicrobia bacterium CG1_02_63_36]|nr:MAG: methyltransferase [Elusimicrobia bacterium CG1_02_63_36]PIP84414.1 MAG: methyltransferase [Elusimicrobia bacterium CG22_combo_CG10-13_8_21_14_all_63_91]PJA18667.1 MAG: methyltransferase [Elusimicrobia bacterium CG_4_10_14_0_2_um_filter_63_34]PJB23411.1 MAG: methyltransferase [Elusimicrobia bacterium CG_4_9_14_3_um_filter_62_55]